MNQILTPEDSFAVREEIIRQLKRPKAYSPNGLGEIIANVVKDAVKEAVSQALASPSSSYRTLGEEICSIFRGAIK